MDKDKLLDQLDWVQARIEEIEGQVLNYDPDKKGYKELVDGYNKLVDRYNEILQTIENLDKPDVEMEKIDLERERMRITEEIEQDKINLDREKLRLEREKFAHDIEVQTKKDVEELIFRSLETGVKVLVPIASLTGIVYVANLAYMNDADFKLCNGRVIGGVKDILKVLTMKV